MECAIPGFIGWNLHERYQFFLGHKHLVERLAHIRDDGGDTHVVLSVAKGRHRTNHLAIQRGAHRDRVEPIVNGRLVPRLGRQRRV